jgi:hypothetical protein
MEEMMKFFTGICCFFVLFVYTSCSSMDNSTRDMIGNINALGYSDDQTNIDFAKKIWNGPVKVESNLLESNYLARLDINNVNLVTIYIPYNIKGDLEYNIEVATILSYYAEIYRQVQAKETVSIDKAILHMKNSYNLMLANLFINNNKEPENPRQFKEFINNISNMDYNGSVYYFNGTPLIEDEVVIRYTM